MLKAAGEKQFFLILNFKKMKTTKMSLATIQGKLSRAETKNIMAGSGGETCNCNSSDTCPTATPCCVSCSGGSYAGVCHTECA